MTSTSASAGQPLRQLRWPALPPVDLLDECRWLVSLDARNADPARELRPIKGDGCHSLDLLSDKISTQERQSLSKQRSPYRQALRRPKPPTPSPGSPAQQAAKSILKLKEGLLRLDGSERIGTALQADRSTSTIAACQLQQERVIRPNTRSPPKPIESSLSATTTGTSSTRSPSPDRAKTPLRSPSRRRKKPTREERDLAQKQARLAVWLKANPDARPADELQDSRGGDAAPYSGEVASRIASAMQCRGPLDAGVRLWDDPVRSLLAAEMTSESVFGGAVPTRALAFPVSPSSPQVATQPEAAAASARAESLLSEVEKAADDELDNQAAEGRLAPAVTKLELSELAQSVFGTAHRQVADGAVADALATLEAGIRQSLSKSQAHLDAVSRAHGVGFNYSALAHASAIKLQLYYRARHRRRVNRLALLQRQWRWWQARKRAWGSLRYASKQAAVIQRCYRSWHIRITRLRSTVHIQRCFRVYASQKFLVRFHQVCRLLLARRARRRQVKTRVRVIGTMVLWLRKRRRRIALVQGLWRRRRAQAQLATLLAHVSAMELGRRAREDEFVAQRLALALASFRDFLANTEPGRKLVRWQAEKPWLRFRRLRRDRRLWSELPLSARIDAVAGVLPTRRFRGLELRALCQMLIGADRQLPALPKELEVTTHALTFLATPADADAPQAAPPVGCCVCCPWWAQVREKAKRTRAKLSCRAATLWWALATYPKEYCAARIWPVRGRRRVQARQQLEDDFARVVAAFLRVWFRRVDSKTNTPPFACEWCSAPFGTARDYFVHGKCAAARALAEAEWAALCRDLEFARKRWPLSRQTRDPPVRPAIHEFDFDAASVRRLRCTRSRRKALRALVAVLESCAVGESANAVIPLDLAGFVLHYLDDSSPLVQTAEHQLVRWSALVGSMTVENSRLRPEGAGNESRWIRKDELRSRLTVGSKWRGVLTRLRRRIGRQAAKYRALRVPQAGDAVAFKPKAPWTVGAKWTALQARVGRAVDSRRQRRQALTPPSVAGTRVLPV